MKWLLLFILLPVQADDFKLYSNGMTCFQDREFTYGCSGGPVRRGETYMDMDSGELIHQINRSNAMNMDTGELIMTPRMPYREDEYGEED